MKRRSVLLLAVWVLLAASAQAHETPFSSVDLRVRPDGIAATVKVPAASLARDLRSVTADTPRMPAGVAGQKEKLAEILAAHLRIAADGKPLTAAPEAAEALPEEKAVVLSLRFPWTRPPERISVRAALFSADPLHRTLVSLYAGDDLERQEIVDADRPEFAYVIGARQGTGAVIRRFVAAGIHHIFIGPDHILFIIGLLLLGGRLTQLLKIVTAFTIAHSVTLALAALDLFNPPAPVIEPLIALSIVCVGVDNLTAGREARDLRVLFALGFGFIHGFGFANVLRELYLPREALGWSLFAFNSGVEIGQACIVLAVAPLLAAVRRRSLPLARRIAVAGSFGVIAAGGYWFVQRVLSPG